MTGLLRTPRKFFVVVHGISTISAMSLCTLRAAGAQTRGCRPVSDSTSASIAVSLHAGSYHLILVATSGAARDASASGPLELWPTHPSDRSPRTGQTARASAAEEPLVGAAALDFAAVNAPIFLGDTSVPPPSSRDPVFPGVVVLRDTAAIGTTRPQYVLLIGTLRNRRADRGWVDGAGIALWVRDVDADGFSGTWDRWGILAGGAGYFCAQRIK